MLLCNGSRPNPAAGEAQQHTEIDAVSRARLIVGRDSCVSASAMVAGRIVHPILGA